VIDRLVSCQQRVSRDLKTQPARNSALTQKSNPKRHEQKWQLKTVVFLRERKFEIFFSGGGIRVWGNG
jgi:hypothetical protein